MKLNKTLLWAGAIAAAVPMVKKLLAGARSRGGEPVDSYVPVIEKTLQEHSGEETQIVRAFAGAVDRAPVSR